MPFVPACLQVVTACYSPHPSPCDPPTTPTHPSQPHRARRKSIGELGVGIAELRAEEEEESTSSSTRSAGAYKLAEEKAEPKSERQKARARRRSSVEGLATALIDGVKKLVGSN